MALQSEELFGDPVSQTPNLRAWPEQDGVQPGRLEDVGVADLEIPHLSPLVDNGDGTWGVWADADLNTVAGFLWAPDEAHTGLAAGESLIQILKRGVVHHDDVPLPAAQTQATLTTALKD